MPESKAEDKKPKDKPKITIEDNDNEAVKNRGVNFLSGVLLVVLVVAAIGSFSIVAMELGEIKRLVGLKESTGKEIKENEKQISSLKDTILKLINGKLTAEQEGAQASKEAEEYERSAKLWKESNDAYKKAVSDFNATYVSLYRKRIFYTLPEPPGI